MQGQSKCQDGQLISKEPCQAYVMSKNGHIAKEKSQPKAFKVHVALRVFISQSNLGHELGLISNVNLMVIKAILRSVPTSPIMSLKRR